MIFPFRLLSVAKLSLLTLPSHFHTWLSIYAIEPWAFNNEKVALISCSIPLMFTSIKVLDDKNVRRRFRASNYQSTTRVKPFICTMPMRLDVSWTSLYPQLIINNFVLNFRRAGIKFNSTCLTSPAAPTEPTTSRLFASKSTRIAESAEFTSPTDFTQRMSYLLSSNFSFRFKSLSSRKCRRRSKNTVMIRYVHQRKKLSRHLNINFQQYELKFTIFFVIKNSNILH